jgi:exonuclease SbcC
MRPLRLTIENFAAFRGKQAVLDLSDLDLFAISGPTGAGKSSLLDALVFALYGRIPRLDKGVLEMVSLGRERLSVVLDFACGGRTFRVARLAQRGRAGQARLEELHETRVRPLLDAVRKVDDEIERLLGLDYNAFTQAVLLPQGEFARFLKSEPRKRRDMLRELLRLGLYEDMRSRAQEHATSLRAQVGSQELLLQKEYAGATPEALATLEVELNAGRARRETLQDELARRQAQLAALEARATALRERRDLRAAAARLKAADAQVRHDAQRLLAARRADSVLPLVDAAEHARAQATADADQQAQAEAHAAAMELRVQSARSARERATMRAQELPALEERLAALDGVLALLAPRDEARARVAQAEAQLAQRQSERDQATQQAQQVEARAELLAEQERRAAATCAALGYDAGAHARLLEHVETVTRLEATRADLAQRERRQRELRQQLATGTEEARAATQARDAAAHALTQAGTARDAAEGGLRVAERQDAAAHLQRELELGAACPVCDQTVHVLPVPPAPLASEQARDTLAQARAAEQRARTAVAAAEQRLARAQAALEQAQGEDTRLASELGTLAARLAQLVAALQPVLAEWAPATSVAAASAERPRQVSLFDVAPPPVEPADALPEQRLRELLARCAEQKQEHEAAQGALDKARQELQAAQHLAQQQRQEARRLDEHVGELRQGLAAARADAERLTQRLFEVTRDPDPAGERERLAARRAALAEALRQATADEHEVALEHAAAQSAAQQAAARATQQTAHAQATGDQAARALADSGFADASALRAAQLPLAEQERLQAQRDAHERAQHTVEERLRRLEDELGAVELDEAGLGAEQAACAATRQAHADALQAEEATRQRLLDLQRRAQAAADLMRVLDEQRRSLELQRRLAEDLRNDRFQAFLLEEAFRELVQGASLRLFELTGRYTLDYREERFDALDHDNAGERRSVDTLSGGETFLASLALALELSQQVQRAAGAVRLDSLFIDEGFGTLDPETRETIAAALESLKVGGRMVGIVTHLPELTERFEVRLLVEKRREGSRVQVQRA